MKRLILILFFMIIFFLAYHLLNGMPYNSYLSNNSDIFLDKIEYNSKIPSIIKDINARNSSIKSLSCKKMSIKYSQKINMRLYGDIAYEEKNLRLKVSHILTGKEIDMGSNDTFFWFWSKRSKPSALYYASHKDLEKTFLRTVLSPEWIISSLYFTEIKTNKCFFKNYENMLSVYEEKLDHNNNKLIFVTIIDLKKELILGKYLYNEEEKLIASTEYYDFSNNIPNTMIIRWHEENIQISLDLKFAEYNCDINQKLWDIPNIKEKINLAE